MEQTGIHMVKHLLKMNKKQLSFEKNNINQGIINCEIQTNIKYHLFVSLSGNSSKIEFLCCS